MTEELRRLAEHGQSVWVDDLSRSELRGGTRAELRAEELFELIDLGVTGLTANPTVFRTAVTDGDAYDGPLAELLTGQPDPKEVLLELAVQDARDVCDLFEHRFLAAQQRFEGWVSQEVDPRLADDTDATVAEAARLHKLVDRPNLLVAIPATDAGVPAVEEAVAAGIPVSVTLLFSTERHRAVAMAYQRGLRRLHAAGGDLSTTASVASFAVSSVDTEANRRLTETAGDPALRSTLAVANAKLAYQNYREMFSGPEWDDLAAHGARPQRCLWTSIAPKEPALAATAYVEALIGPDTVTTMPRTTIQAFREHGKTEPTLETGLDEARRTLDRFAAAGVDHHDLTATLEHDGIRRLVESFDALCAAIEKRRPEFR